MIYIVNVILYRLRFLKIYAQYITSFSLMENIQQFFFFVKQMEDLNLLEMLQYN